jgi:hypothetical protein
MPASRSPRASSGPSFALPIAISAIALLAVLIVALPASLAGHLLPARIQATDFSGSIWHGAAQKIIVNGTECGAAEWQLHPLALLRLRLGIDVHWVKGDFALAAHGNLGLRGVELDSLSGGGALEELRSMTALAGWRGTVAVAIDHLSAGFNQLNALHGDINVADLRAASIADEANLGAYVMHFDGPADDAHGLIEGQIRDTEGPLEVQAVLALSPREHTSSLTGTARERASAPAALRTALENLAQLRPRDAQGRIPLEIEFSF